MKRFQVFIADLPLTHAPVVGSHAYPEGQCSHPDGFVSGPNVT